MPSITRETIIDRRQPTIRWSAVLAGTTIAVGLWGVLQLLGVAGELAAIDPDVPASAQGGALGIVALSLLAPLLATFVGGYVAAKLAGTHDQKVAGAHGLVVWGLTAVIGFGATLCLGAALAVGSAHAPAEVGAGHMSMDRTMQHEMERGPHRMEMRATPKDDAARVASQVGTRIEAFLERMSAARSAEHAALQAMERTGQALLSLGAAILLAIGTALLGSLLAVHAFGRGGTGARREGELYTTPPAPTTTTIVGPGTPTV